MRNFFAEITFWSHVIIVLFWYSLFFVSTNWWQNKIQFHFYLTLGIVGHQFLWGAMIFPWTKKYRLVCFLTTIMQLLRKQKISDHQNYSHSFVKESFGRFGFTLPHWFATIAAFTTSAIVTIQYFFFR